VVVARRALRDPSPEVRRSAVRELVRQDDRDAVRALTRLARRDPSPEVRAAAEEGLRELGAEDAIAETDEGPAGPDDPSENGDAPPDRPGPGGVDYDSLSTGALVALLSNPDLDVRESAVDALGYNEHYGAIPALWNAFFSEPSWFVRDLILDALEDMDQEVEEARELLYLQEETEVDLEAIAESLK
jgi:HEAT repeat protein